MNRHKVEAPNDFRRVSSVKEVLPNFVRREYRRELRPLIKELNALLPRFKKQVSPELYALERNELMLLTGCFYDDSLDIYGLEALAQQLRGHRQIFVTALTEAPAVP